MYALIIIWTVYIYLTQVKFILVLSNNVERIFIFGSLHFMNKNYTRQIQWTNDEAWKWNTNKRIELKWNLIVIDVSIDFKFSSFTCSCMMSEV